MRNLIKKLEIIDFKYQKLKENDSFNLFEILRKRNDEVNLHSKFISELLSPKGSHGQGVVFLKLFLNYLSIEGYVVNEKSIVESERYIGEINEEKTEGGRVDIIIENIQDNSIIIENKIDANDQENQLLRYYNYKPDSIIYYLTLFGNEPSDYSLGKMNPKIITNISYRDDINNWLTLCIEKSVKYPSLRESIIQYQKLINELTGNSTSMDEREEIIALISEDKNVLQAKKIADNWVHIKWHTEFDFWNNFSDLIIRDGYKILETQKFSDITISGVVHNKRNRNPHYGIMFKIISFKGYDICLYIDRSFDDVHYGVRAMKGNNSNVNEDLLLLGIAKELKKKSTWGDYNHSLWLGGHYLEPSINFEHFSDENTLLLLNKNQREKYINKVWYDIKEFISQTKIIVNNHQL